jgi:ribosomal protein S27E
MFFKIKCPNCKNKKIIKMRSQIIIKTRITVYFCSKCETTFSKTKVV